jgi:dihydroorotate dehydrogenase (fumarate)
VAGAKATMLASELLQHGLGRIGEILDEMGRWMEEREYQSVAELRGSISQMNIGEPAAFERANYMKVLDL